MTRLLLLSLLVTLLSACSGGTELKQDTGAAADRGAPDAIHQPDTSPTTDTAPKTDATSTPDIAAKPDSVAKPDASKKPDAKVSPDGPAAACSGVKCVLQNDCCFCKARKSGTTMPVCPQTNCKQPTCGGIMLKKPALYCFKGHCLVTDEQTKCATDADCRRVNNCCDCLALPKGALDPPCAVKSCFVPDCTAKGMATAQARCVAGVCKLQ